MLRTSFISENVTRFWDSVFWQLSNKLSARFSLGNYSFIASLSITNTYLFTFLKASFDKKLMWHFSSVSVCVCVPPLMAINKTTTLLLSLLQQHLSTCTLTFWLCHFNSAIPFAGACERIYWHSCRSLTAWWGQGLCQKAASKQAASMSSKLLAARCSVLPRHASPGTLQSSATADEKSTIMQRQGLTSHGSSDTYNRAVPAPAATASHKHRQWTTPTSTLATEPCAHCPASCAALRKWTQTSSWCASKREQAQEMEVEGEAV